MDPARSIHSYLSQHCQNVVIILTGRNNDYSGTFRNDYDSVHCDPTKPGLRNRYEAHTEGIFERRTGKEAHREMTVGGIYQQQKQKAEHDNKERKKDEKKLSSAN